MKQNEKGAGRFDRWFWGVALVAFALLGCFAFPMMAKEEAVGAFADWVQAVGAAKFDTIGMELEFHQALTEEALAYDSKLYTAATTLSGGDPLFKIVAETSKKTEIVTGIIHGDQEADMAKLRDWISVGRQLSLGVKSTIFTNQVEAGSMVVDRANAGEIKKLGKQFDYQSNNGALSDNPEIRGHTDPLTWKTGRKCCSWSPQLTAQGAPEPHLNMIGHACKGDPVDQNPPQTENTPAKKLKWIVQEEMCRGVKVFLETPAISETKESICFLPKAKNIATVLTRGGEDFSTWCLKKFPALAQKERNGPGHDSSNKYKYDDTLKDLLDWANGETKNATSGEDPQFPDATDTLMRIEYRRAENFWVLQEVITGTGVQKRAKGLDVVKALFQGCVPKKAGINNAKADCSVP